MNEEQLEGLKWPKRSLNCKSLQHHRLILSLIAGCWYCWYMLCGSVTVAHKTSLHFHKMSGSILHVGDVLPHLMAGLGKSRVRPGLSPAEIGLVLRLDYLSSLQADALGLSGTPAIYFHLKFPSALYCGGQLQPEVEVSFSARATSASTKQPADDANRTQSAHDRIVYRMTRICDAFFADHWPCQTKFRTLKFFVRLYRHLESSIPQLGNLCVVCGRRQEHFGLRPVPCNSKACNVLFDEHGTGADLRDIYSKPVLADVLISMASAACRCTARPGGKACSNICPAICSSKNRQAAYKQVNRLIGFKCNRYSKPPHLWQVWQERLMWWPLAWIWACREERLSSACYDGYSTAVEAIWCNCRKQTNFGQWLLPINSGCAQIVLQKKPGLGGWNTSMAASSNFMDHHSTTGTAYCEKASKIWVTAIWCQPVQNMDAASILQKTAESLLITASTATAWLLLLTPIAYWEEVRDALLYVKSSIFLRIETQGLGGPMGAGTMISELYQMLPMSSRDIFLSMEMPLCPELKPGV